MFPAAAALGWAVLVYIGIDFGFWGKVFDMSAGRRAHLARLAAKRSSRRRCWCSCSPISTSTAGTCATRTSPSAGSSFSARWSAVARVRSGGRLRHRAHFARPASRSLGFGLVVYLATHGFDRAVLLIPTWLLLVVWVFAAGLTVTGIVTNDIVGPALLGGLVLIVMLIGFTVMQHAFAGGVAHGDRVRRRAARARADRRRRHDLGLGRVRRPRLHQPGDRGAARPQARRARRPGGATGSKSCIRSTATASAPRSTASLEQRRGRVAQDFRLRTHDGHYLWFAPEGAAGGRLRRRGGAPASARSPT